VSYAGYVAAGYLLTLVALVGYAVAVIVRGRKLGAQLPPEERRWM
jgi:heme exporter protein D